MGFEQGYDHGKKSSKAEMEIKIHQIYTMILKGIVSRMDILQNISKMNELSKAQKKKIGWVDIKGTDRSKDELIKRARDQMTQEHTKDRKEIKGMIAAQLIDLYREARRQNKTQTGNNILKNLAMLEGVSILKIKGDFTSMNYDVHLTPEEEEAYKKRLKQLYGDNILDKE